MIKKFTLVGVLFSLLFIPSYSQSTKIYGTIENADAYTIQLKTFSDFLSMTEEVVDSFEISKYGTFELKTSLNATKLHVLVIGFQKAYVYLEPDKEYQLKIKYDKEREQITFVNKAQLDFEFIDLPNDALNHQIAEFNLKANEFLVSNFDQIYKRRNKKIVESFSKEIKESFQNSSGFLKNYIDFRLASIEYSSGLKNKAAIFKTYFEDKKILFDHDEYFQFFKEFFENYLMNPNPYFDTELLNRKIFNGDDLGSMLAILKQDPMLQQEKLRTMVLLKGLYDLYFYPSANKSTILSLFHQINQESPFETIKKVATNLQQKLTYLQPGTDFPKYFIDNLENDKRVSSQMRKAIFVNFFTIPCSACMREMDSISSMFNRYSDEVQFISIVLNTTEEELDKLHVAKKYPWQIKQAEQPFKLAETYQIRSLPAYFLIDSKGKILMNPAFQPWQGFSLAFKSVFNY